MALLIPEHGALADLVRHLGTDRPVAVLTVGELATLLISGTKAGRELTGWTSAEVAAELGLSVSAWRRRVAQDPGLAALGVPLYSRGAAKAPRWRWDIVQIRTYLREQQRLATGARKRGDRG